MNKGYHRDDVADRSGWAPGPWDNEPDFYEWITEVGYPAWMARLDCGAWFSIVEAPCPALAATKVSEGQAFFYYIKSLRHKQIDHSICMTSATDREGIVGYCLSMEHWESPGPAYGGRTWNRGPYKTLEETKQITENIAKDIFETLKEKKYVDYFSC